MRGVLHWVMLHAGTPTAGGDEIDEGVDSALEHAWRDFTESFVPVYQPRVLYDQQLRNVVLLGQAGAHNCVRGVPLSHATAF